jgi:glycine oxidase
MKNNDFDVIIIGAGVIGFSIAFRLKRSQPGLKIAVLGDPMNSLMASRAAAGMLAPFGECERADRFFEFCRESLDKYSGFIEELISVSGVPVFFSMQGSLMPSAFYGNGWDDLKRFFQEEKIPHEIWQPEKVRAKVPYLSEECGEVLWVGEGQVNNRQLHDSLVAAAVKLGVVVLEENVTGFIKDKSAI